MNIRKLEESDSAAAAIILADAFDDEPVFRATITDPMDRHACLLALFEADVRNACRYGGAIAVGTEQNGDIGIAYWTSQPEPDRSDAEMAELGFAAVFSKWGAVLRPIGDVEGTSHRLLRFLPTPWQYLAGIGVRPEFQGQGYGSALMRHFVDEIDRSGQSSGLSTDRPINVKLYERFGFRVVHHDAETPIGVPFWTMERPRA